MKLNLGVRGKLFLGTSVSILLVLGVMAAILIFKIDGIVLNKTNSDLASQTDNIATHVKEILKETEDAAKSIARSTLVKNYIKDAETLEDESQSEYYRGTIELLQDIQKDNSDINQTYVAFSEVNKSNFNTDIKEDGTIEILDIDALGIQVSERDWFKDAVSNDGFAYAEPYEDEISKALITTVSIPIKDDSGKVIGVAGVDVNITTIMSMISEFTIGETGDAFFVTDNGNIIYDKNEEIAGKNLNNLSGEYSDYALAMNKGLSRETTISTYKNNLGIKKNVYFSNLEGSNWTIGVDIDDNEIRKDIKTVSLILILSISISVGVLLLVLFVLSTKILKPLKGLISGFNRAAEGDFTARYNCKSKDEIGNLADNFNHMMATLQELVLKVIESVNVVTTSTEDTLENIEDLNSNLQEVASVTEELSAIMEETSGSAESMLSTVESISTLSEDIVLNVNDGTRLADDATEIGVSANTQFENARDKVRDVFLSAKEDLQSALEKSNSVVEINNLSNSIIQITNQTNLLALNASIEAARAGEAGKGFSVVAKEIGALANDSKATIERIQSIVDIVLSAVDELSKASLNLLGFVENDVQKDYDETINISSKYSEGTKNIKEVVEKFKVSANNIEDATSGILEAANNVASATNEGTSGTLSITNKISELSTKSTNVSEDARNTKDNVDSLMEIINKFKVE